MPTSFMTSVATRHINIARLAAQRTGCTIRETRLRHKLDILSPIEVVGTASQLRVYQLEHKRLLDEACKDIPPHRGS